MRITVTIDEELLKAVQRRSPYPRLFGGVARSLVPAPTICNSWPACACGF